MKIAIVMPGNLDCYKASYESVMKNLIEPNDADVFILASKDIQLKVLSEDSKIGWTYINQQNGQEDIDNVKRCFGKHLKVFKFDSDIPGYEDDAEEQAKAADKRVSSWITDQGKKYSQYYDWNDKHLVNARHYIDRFVKMKYIVKLVEEYEKENNIKYDYIVRARIDFIYEDMIIFEKARFRFDTLDALWIAESDIAKEILSNLVNHIGEYDGGTILENGDYRLDRNYQVNKFVAQYNPEKFYPFTIGTTLFQKEKKLFIENHSLSEKKRISSGTRIGDYYKIEKGENYYDIPENHWLWVYTYFRK